MGRAFPSKNKEIRQILLQSTFECPDQYAAVRIGFVDHIKVRPKNDNDRYEIARMPDTNMVEGFQKNGDLNWKVEPSRILKSYLRDSLEIDYHP